MLRSAYKSEDERWLEQTLGRHKDRIYAFAMHYTRRSEDAAEIVQDTFVRLWKNRRELSDEHVQPWLYQVCRNLCIDRLRSRTSRLRYEIRHEDGLGAESEAHQSADPLPDDVVHELQLRRLLLDEVDAMNEPFRTLVILRDIEQLSYKEIGAVTNLPITSVKVYLHRARRRLRESLPAEFQKELEVT